jgi:orotate phosphoribosyltransferase
MGNKKSTDEKEENFEKIYKILGKANVLEFGNFKLPNGRFTPYYVDLGVLPSFSDTFCTITDLFTKYVIRDIGLQNFDRIAGIPTTGIPFASIVAYKLKKPYLYIRQKLRLNGREKRIEGFLLPGDRVLIIDDLITTGTTLKKAVLSLRAEGGVVEDVFVFLDREEGGKKRLKKMGINLIKILGMGGTAYRLHEIGVIDKEQLKTILNQKKA